MKRLHVHVAVQDLERSIQFYSTLFGANPTVLKNDYAKWQLDDPRVNFAISNRSGKAGLDHLGIQAETGIELAETAERLSRSGEALADEGTTTCCYAVSDKRWIVDPSGIAWETFHTLGTSDTFNGQDVQIAAKPEAAVASAACCEPAPVSTKTACCGPAANVV